ncbi:hypothetical protein C8Q76DRAFT_633953 [Earliella scabrosa]|nr:hypothetical protein C8Q76DRAFT_633953 [Earliella scabrosa]
MNRAVSPTNSLPRPQLLLEPLPPPYFCLLLAVIIRTETVDGHGTGPKGPLPQKIIAMHPNASFIGRSGKANTWDNADFRKAVEATGKKQMIIASIAIRVYTPLPSAFALSLVEAGYIVFANSDASGTFNRNTTHDAIDRMGAAGVQVLSMFSVAGELMRDWRNTPGAPGMLPFFDKYMPEYAVHACAHDAAVENGALSDL